jgi:hypothetical protein
MTTTNNIYIRERILLFSYIRVCVCVCVCVCVYGVTTRARCSGIYFIRFFLLSFFRRHRRLLIPGSLITVSYDPCAPR